MRRLAPALLLASALAASPLRADKELVAIGDSITAGSSWPASCSICPVVFDCTAACDATSSGREGCAHVHRLDNWMDGWMGAADHVVNAGIGGEKTNGAVSRLPSVLDSECGTPGDCIAVVLMHGTNDMSGSVSEETARDNLALMIAEARSRNIDTLLMTIIRKGDHLDNQKWEDYKDLILALAASEGLQSVNPWQTLCPDQSCVDDNYWLENSPPCNDPDGTPNPGHLDPDGYDVLTDLIKAVFPGAAPAAPAPTAPAGDIADPQPDFVWPEVADARWYELDVDGSTTWWEAAAHCDMGTCSVDPGVVLSEAGHAWRVRGRNLRGLGTWSADTAFTVWGLPGTPVAVAPTGVLFESAPVYEWLEASAATEYDLEVKDAGGTIDAQATGLLASTVCSEGFCSYQEGTVLSDPDDYTLRVKGRNPGAEGSFSSPGADFSIIACSDPSPEDLANLEPSPVTTTEVVTYCGPVTAGGAMAYTIDATGDLTVHTRDGFEAGDGFTVKGRLTVRSP